MFWRRIIAIFDFTNIRLSASNGESRPAWKFFTNLGVRPCVISKNVVQHQNLAIHIRAGTDADYRDIQGIADHLAYFIGNTLQQNNVRSGILQSLCRCAHFRRLVGLSTLHLETTDLMNGLRLKPR